MIGSLRGTIVDIAEPVVLIDVQGVGYEVQCTRQAIGTLEPQREAFLVIYTDVKEDSIRLFGFVDRLEKAVFGLLLKVSGIGAKTASEILSKIECRELLRIIGNADLQRLLAIKGVGRKTAERILVELADRVGEFADERGALPVAIGQQAASPIADAIEAMVALGFPRKEAERAVREVDTRSAGGKAESGEIVREALKFV